MRTRLTCIALSSSLLIGAAPPPAEQPPGVVVLCVMVFVDVAAEAGRRCYAGQDPTYQAHLEGAEAKFDAYFLRNAPATPDQLAEFKRDQAGVGAPTFDCKNDDIAFAYKAFKKPDPSMFTIEIDKLLARSGKPTFGDCT